MFFSKIQNLSSRKKRTNYINFKGAAAALSVMLRRKQYRGTKPRFEPQYYVGLYLELADYTEAITVKWTTTVRWKTNYGIPKELVLPNSKTFTTSGGFGGSINPTPSESSMLDISIEITSWSVATKPNQKRALSINSLNTEPCKIARISMQNKLTSNASSCSSDAGLGSDSVTYDTNFEA